jgi:putative membrane protein insertion efficiency factor
MEILKKINLIAAKPLVLAISAYQKTLSPDHGLFKAYFPHGYCKFYPTCSDYGKQVLQSRGLTGIPKIIIRVIRCNPLTAPKVDLA